MQAQGSSDNKLKNMSTSVQNTEIIVSKKLVMINSMAALAGRLIDVGVLFWVQRYLIKNIGVDEYSLLPLVGSLISLIPLFTAAFTSGISRYLVEAYARGDTLQVKKIVSSVWPVILVVTLFLMGLVSFFTFNIENLLNIPQQKETLARVMLLMGFCNLLLEINSAPFIAGFNIRQKFYLRNILDTSFVFFRVILLIFLLTFFKTSVFWVVLANFLSNLFKTATKLIVSRRLVPSLQFNIQLFNLATALSVFSFGLWTLLSRVGEKIRSASDPILLNLFTTPMDISIYYIGALFSDHFRTILSLMLSPLQPPLIAMYTKQEFKRLELLFYRLNKYLMWSCLFFITPALFFRKQIIIAYVGDKFIESSTVLALLFIPLFFTLGLQLIWVLAPAMGKIKFLSIMTCLSQIINLLLTIILLKFFHLGATGSALSTCIVGLTVIPVFLLPYSLHLIQGKLLRWIQKTFLPGILPCCVCFLSLATLSNYVLPNSLFAVLICCFTGSLFYMITVMLCTTATDRSEIHLIFQTVMKKVQPAK
nr:hypothetical protein [uncultured Desulfobacter sp.]